MSHEITNAAFSNRPAWHGLGTVVPRNLEPEEGYKLAGLDWNVTQEPMQVSLMTGEGFQTLEVPNRIALMRSDTYEILGTASERYEPFQNADLLGMAKEIQEIDGSAYLESALQLRGGRDVVLLLRMREWDIFGDSTVSYVCLWNSHDGSAALSAFGTEIRIICANTLQWASADAGQLAVRVRHLPGIRTKADALIQACKDAREASGSWEDVARSFAGADVSRDETDTLIRESFQIMRPVPTWSDGDDPKAYAKSVKRWNNAYLKFDEDIRFLLTTETCKTDATVGNAYGVYNAVTEWIDRFQPRVRDRQAAKLDPVSTGNVNKRSIARSFASALSLSI